MGFPLRFGEESGWTVSLAGLIRELEQRFSEVKVASKTHLFPLWVLSSMARAAGSYPVDKGSTPLGPTN